MIDSKAGKTEAELTNISTLFSGLLKHVNLVQNEINNISKSVGFTKLWFHLILWRVTFSGPWDCFCLSFWIPNANYHILGHLIHFWVIYCIDLKRSQTCHLNLLLRADKTIPSDPLWNCILHDSCMFEISSSFVTLFSNDGPTLKLNKF